MALTDSETSELAQLNQKYGPLGGAQTTMQPESLGGRVLKTIGNLPFAADQDLLQTGANILNLGVPDEDKLAAPTVAKPFAIAPPAANDYAGMAVDTLGNVAAGLPSFLIPEAGIGKVGEALGVGGKTLAFLKGAGAGVVNSAGGTPAEAAEQGGLLGLTSLTGFIPGVGGRVAASAAAGAGAGGLSYLNGQSGAASTIQGGVFAALGGLAGLAGGHANDSIPVTRTTEKAMGVDSLLPGTETPYGPTNVANPLPDLVPSPEGNALPTPGLRLDDGSQQELPFVTSQPQATQGPKFTLDGGEHPELPLSGSPAPVADPTQTLVPQPQGELPWFGKDSSRMVGPAKSAQESAQAIMDAQSKIVPPMKSAQDSAEAIMANKTPLKPNTVLDPSAPSLVGKAAANLGLRYDGVEPDEAVTHPIFGKMRDAQHQFTLLDEGKETTFNLPTDATYSDLKAKTGEVRESMSGDIVNGDEPDVTSQSVTPTFPDGHPTNTLDLQGRSPNQDTVLSTAVNAGDGRILVGGRWDEPHEGIGMRHDIDDVPQSHRGFLVHNSDGTQTFSTRGDALETARSSGQLRNADQTTPLNSTDLVRADSEKGTRDTPKPTAKAASPEPPPEPTAKPEPELKASAALSGEPVSKSEPSYMTSDLSHLSESDREDAEFIRGSIRRQLAPGEENNPAGAAYAVEQLKGIIGTGAIDAPQTIKNVTSQPPPQAASWLFADDKPTAKEKRTYSSKQDYLDDNYVPPSDEEDERGDAHQGELTNELGTQANDYEVENDPVDNVEVGTDTEDSDTLTQILDDERQDQAATKETVAGPSAEEDSNVQITDDDRKEFAEDTDDAPLSSTDQNAKSETDKLMGLMGMLEKNPKSKALNKAVRDRTGLGVKRRGTRGKNAEAGFIDAGVVKDVIGLLGRYSPSLLAGGGIGAYYDDENRVRGFFIGAAAGGMIQRYGAGFIKMLMQDVPKGAKANYDLIKDVTSQPGARFTDIAENMAAEDFGATGQGLAAYVREGVKGFTRTDDARYAKGISNLSGIVNELQEAIKVGAKEYPDLSPSERAVYEKYQQEPWFVPDPTTGKPVPNTGVETRFTMDMAAHPGFSGSAMTMRRLRVVMQQMFADTVKDPEYKAAILESLGRYTTDSFRIFSESKFKPSESDIDAHIKELNYTKVFPGYDEPMMRKTLQAQLDEIYKNRALGGMGGGGGDSGTFDSLLKTKMRMPEDLQKELLAAVPGAKSVDEIVTSQRYLPPDLQDKLAEAIRNKQYLTPAMRQMYGFHSDPFERDVATVMKLVPGAKAASLYRQIADGTDTKSRLPMSMTPEDAVARRAIYQAQLSVAKDPKVIADLQTKLLDLKNRVKLPDSDNLGILAGRYVPSGMADILPDMTTTGKGQTLPITTAIMEGTRVVKAGQTLLNPISHVRWVYNIPLLAGLSNTGPGWARTGWMIAKGKGDWMGVPAEVVARRMEDLGIKDTSIAHSEFNTTAKQALSGYVDSSLIDKFFSNPIVSKLAEAYGAPDNAVRIGTFLKREQQLLGRYSDSVALGKLHDDIPPEFAAGKTVKEASDQWAEREAIRYTNRYTVNYSNVPGGIGALRKMPFVSLYLTYSYELARITKNILVDASGKGPYGKEMQPSAIVKLATLAVVPAAIQAGGRALLSPDDQKAWDESRALDQPYAQPRYKMPLYRNPDGTFKYIDFTSYVPTGDWNMMANAIASGSWKQMIAANPVIGTDNTPALNVASEIITGQDSRTGRPINTIGRSLDAARQELAPALFGGYEFDNLMRALQPNAEGGIGITRLGSGKGYSIGDLLATYLTGLRPTTINPDWQKYTTVQDAQAQITTEKQYLMDTLRSDTTDETKQAATKRYADAVKLIVAHLQTQMGMANN